MRVYDYFNKTMNGKNLKTINGMQLSKYVIKGFMTWIHVNYKYKGAEFDVCIYEHSDETVYCETAIVMNRESKQKFFEFCKIVIEGKE